MRRIKCISCEQMISMETGFKYCDECYKKLSDFTKKPLKLNLGCNEKKIYGYVNVDLNPEVFPDLLDDVFVLSKVQENSVDKILAVHVLEHANIKQSKEVLKRWYSVLKPEGILQVAVPNLEKLFGLYLWKKDIRLLQSALWGSQQNEFMYHKMGWDFKTLKEDLEEVGFKNVHIYDWKTTDHAYSDSYEQAFVPHLDKDKGELVSLNVEATK